MLTTSQLRAARALINMSVEDLASACGLSGDVITEAETSSGNVDPAISDQLTRTLESRGVVFVSAGQQDASGAGVRLQAQTPEEGIRPQNLNAANDG